MIGRLIQLESGKLAIEHKEENPFTTYIRIFNVAPWYLVESSSEVPLAQMVYFWPVFYNGSVYASFE